MKIDTVSWLLGKTGPFWAPADEGAGGGGGTDGDDAGSGTSGDEGATQTTETVLGGDQTDDKSTTGDDGDGEAKKDDNGDGKDDKSDDDGKKDDDKQDDGADEVPEDGKYEFELPEGVELDDEKKEYWSGQFKEIGLTRGQAQKLIELQSEQVVSEQKAFAEFLENQQKTHLEAAKKDKDIGGDKWAESTRLANLGLKTLGGDAIKNLILTSGNGNNPEMIRELRRIGELVKDDKFEPGASHEAPVSTEKKWYGETTPDTKKG
jgi:hypothetical protein